MSKENEQRIAVVTDSTAYLPPALIAENAIKVVPLYLMLGGQTWLDGVEIDPPAFYKLLESSHDFPTTSQPNVATFQEVFTELAQTSAGIVAILISDELSGTIDSAVSAAASLPDIPIEIIDSRTTSMTLGFSALAAARAAAGGGNIEQVVQAARSVIENSHLYFVVDTLEYLHRGGRIGGAAKLLGSALNLKPILQVRDGMVKAVTKVRTRKKAISRLHELLEGHFSENDKLHLAVINVAARDEANILMEELKSLYHPVEIFVTEVSPVIGAHVGPGTVGVAIYVEKDD
ncbi:MAG: DegV family protein [Anaerolineales bacterium]|nr:DegV family protein [Anaerolineales bacterium]